MSERAATDAEIVRAKSMAEAGFGYFAEPIPYKGRLGLFEVPDEVVRDVMVTRIERAKKLMGHFRGES